MSGSQDPSLWQQLADSRFVQTLVSALGMAAAVGYAIARFLRRYAPRSPEEAELKSRLATGALQEIAHRLNELRETQQDLRERVVRIETILERNNGA